MRDTRPWAPAVGALALAALALAAAASAQAPGSVDGRLLAGDGQPVGGANVSLSPGGPAGVTGPDGSFHLSAEPGTYLLRAQTGNRTVERTVDVSAGVATVVVLSFPPAPSGGAELNPFPFVFLGASMVAVIVGGFYVNKRMSETGLQFDKSVMGGAPARKPFRRRRKKTQRPPPGR